MIGDFHSLDSGSSPDIGISPLFQKWSKIQIVIWFNLSIVKKVEDTAQGAPGFMVKWHHSCFGSMSFGFDSR